MQNQGLIWLLFGYRGRISRWQFWTAVFYQLGGMAIVLVLSAMLTWLLLVIYAGALFVSSLMISIKRLHDRNKGGWWAILFYFVPIGLNFRINDWSLAGQFGEYGGMALQFISLAISIWAFVEIGCLPGTAGTNVYGPDPLDVRRPPSQIAS